MGGARATQPKGPGGRPPKDEHERRVASLRSSVTLAEYAYVRDQARHAGVAMAEYIRRRSLDLPLVVRQGRSDDRLVHELNRIGVNLNILLRDVLTDRRRHDSAAWAALKSKLDGVLDRAIEVLDD